MTAFRTLARLALIAGLTAAPLAAPARAATPFAPVEHFMVAVSVKDLEAETKWYVEKLGFTVEKDVNIANGRVFFRWLKLGTERLELVYSPTAADATPARAAPPAHAGLHGFTHFTMEVKDLAAAKAALAARGVTPVMDITEVKDLGVKVFYLTDPEGNAVEVAQRVAK